MNTMTLTAARRLAGRATRHGHHVTARTVYVFCPNCRSKVETDRVVSGLRLPSTHKQATEMMVEHYRYGDCAAAIAAAADRVSGLSAEVDR